METSKDKEEWKFSTMASGELFVTTTGIWKTHMSFVMNLGLVRPLVLQKKPGLVQEVALYGWMKCSAWVLKVPWRLAGTMDGISTIVTTVKMHQ